MHLDDDHAAPDGSGEYPIALDSPSRFAALREVLRHFRYDEPTVAERLGGKTLAGVPRLADGRTTLGGEVVDANGALIRLFIDGAPLPAPQLRELLGDDALTAVVSLGLLRPSDADADLLAPTVMLTPLQGLWLASDLLPITGSDAAGTRQDFVYSAGNELTASFLAVIPDAPGARVLELCAGTGVAAIRAAARGAAMAVASDLTPRCVHFARFNARLNEVDDRVEVRVSDAWESLGDAQFDLVVAHPPYVPALSHRFDFRDAGADGEHVTRRIVEGTPAHLARGGRLIIRAALSDRRNATIAERVRGWLGVAADEFDLLQLESLDYGLFDAYKGVTKGGGDYVDCERWMRHFASLEIERFAVCFLELRREAFGRSPITERRSVGAELSPLVAEWHFHFARFLQARGATATARMTGQRPRVPAMVRTAVHLEALGDGGWQTVGATVETKWPTYGVVKAPPIAPTLLELCDGTREIGDLLEGLRSAGLVTEEVGMEEVAHLVEILATAGALELPACPLPPRASRGA
ncbi:MAG: methyltransferase [Gemmatimonadota bacterium]